MMASDRAKGEGVGPGGRECRDASIAPIIMALMLSPWNVYL